MRVNTSLTCVSTPPPNPPTQTTATAPAARPGAHAARHAPLRGGTASAAVTGRGGCGGASVQQLAGKFFLFQLMRTCSSLAGHLLASFSLAALSGLGGNMCYSLVKETWSANVRAARVHGPLAPSTPRARTHAEQAVPPPQLLAHVVWEHNFSVGRYLHWRAVQPAPPRGRQGVPDEAAHLVRGGRDAPGQ
eukprot:gene24132-biopygen1329